MVSKVVLGGSSSLPRPIGHKNKVFEGSTISEPMFRGGSLPRIPVRNYCVDSSRGRGRNRESAHPVSAQSGIAPGTTCLLAGTLRVAALRTCAGLRCAPALACAGHLRWPPALACAAEILNGQRTALACAAEILLRCATALALRWRRHVALGCAGPYTLPPTLSRQPSTERQGAGCL
jgi:hypothetical protein